ncbi:MAG: sigma-70 family RNA polymerase sigma factor [Lachnospiraceae bacterium]|nr:sigma-70 family RNA polymerase sigma factor [Lachnospiraceae bacterium]
MSEADGQLYLRFLKEGDKEALRVLYETYKDGLTLFLCGLVGSMDDAEELMMDTFAVLASGTARYAEKRESSFKTWLFAIGKNQARMHLRKHREILIDLQEEENNLSDAQSVGDMPQKARTQGGWQTAIAADQPESALLDNERNAALWGAMKTLPSNYEQVLYLTYFENMTTNEIARVMKKTVKQVYNLSARAKIALKEVLEGTEYSWDI